MPVVPTDQARQASARKLGISQADLAGIDANPVPENQASETNVGVVGEQPAAAPTVPTERYPIEVDTTPEWVRDLPKDAGYSERVPAADDQAWLNELPKDTTGAEDVYNSVAHTDADRNAKVLKYAKAFGQPATFVDNHLEEAEKAAAKPGPSAFQVMAEKYPGSEKFFQNPVYAAVAHDSIGELNGIEQAVNEHGKAYKTLATMNQAVTSMAANLARFPNVVGNLSFLPYNAYQKYQGKPDRIQYPPSNPVADYLDKQAQSYGAQVPELSDSIVEELGAGNYKKAGAATAYQVIAQIPQLAAMVAAGPAHAGKYLATLAASSAAARNKELSDQGVDPAVSAPVALASGAIEAGTEALPLGFIEHMGQSLVKKAGKQGAREVFSSMWKTMFGGAAVEMTEENTAAVTNATMDYVTGVDPDAFKKLPKELANTTIVTFLTGGLAVGPAATLHAAQTIAQNQKTSVSADLYDAIGEKVRNAKLWKRSPEAQMAFLQEVLPQSKAKDVYINPEAFSTYYQSQDESASKALAELGISQKEFEQAKETGTPLKIDHGTFLLKTVDTPAYEGLKPDIKYQPDDRSLNEQKQDEQKLSEDLKTADQQAKEADNKISESGKAVREDVAKQLKAIKENPETSILYRAFEVLGRDLKRDPLALYNEYNLRFSKGETGGAAPELTLNQKNKTSKAENVKSQIEQSLGKEINLDISEGDYQREVDHVYDYDAAGINGARGKRAKKQGFDIRNFWYHGSRGNIESFAKETLGGSTGAGSAKLAHFFASSPKTASDYAQASNNALQLRSSLEEQKANKDMEDFVLRVSEKYGDGWDLKLNKKEIKEQAELRVRESKAIEDFQRSIEAADHKIKYREYEIEQAQNNVKYLEHSLKTKAYEKKNKEQQAYADKLKSLLDNTEFVKTDKGWEVIKKDTKEKIPNIHGSAFEAMKFNHYDSEERVRERIAKIESYIKDNSRAKIKEDLAESKNILEEMKADHRKNLEGTEGQTVYRTVLKMKNPLIVDFKGAEYREVTYRKILETAKENGYDGVIFKNTHDPAFIGSMAEEPELMDVAAVFDANQIRSVNAEFNPKNKNSGNILHQGDENNPRGQISFQKDLTQIVLNLKTANKSTAIHETFHFFVKVVDDLVGQMESVPEGEQTAEQKGLKDRYTKLLEWSGYGTREQRTAMLAEAAELSRIPKESRTAEQQARINELTEPEEKIARAGEKFLYEGKAPTPELQSFFTRFRTWLIHVYKKFGPRAELTPEVRDFFNRLLATEEEINAVDHELNRQPLFTDAQFQGMPVEKVKAYLKAQEEDRERKITEINQKLIAHHEKVRSQEWATEKAALRPEIEKQVGEIPVYKAINSIKSGDVPKLSFAAVAEFGKDVAKGFPKGIVETKKSGEGIPLEVAAELLGFDSANDLVSSLTKAEDQEKLIDRMAEEEMGKRFPDLLEKGLHEDVIAAAHNQSRAKLIRMELDMMPLPVLKEAIRRVARRVPTQKEVRAKAAEIIGGKAIQDIRPNLFLRAEAKAAKEAGVLLAKGDVDGAFASKQKELLNHELYLAATEANEFYDKSLEKFKKIAKSDESMAKTRDTDLVNAARSVLAQFGIGRAEGQAHPETYLKNIKAYDPATYETVSALVDAATEVAGVSDQIPYNDFVTMSETVNAIWDLSREAKQIEVDGKKVELQEAIGALNERLAEKSKGAKPIGLDQAVSDKEKRSMAIASLGNIARRVEHWGYAMDKGAINGPFTKYIIRPILEGTAHYRNALVETMKELGTIVKGFEIKDSKALIDAPELGYKFTKPELIMAVLHSGNDSNLKKLLVGRGWGSLDEEGNLDRSRWDQFIERAFATGLITKSDMDAAQKIWNLNEKLKPAAQKAHKKLLGFYFNEITADPINTPWGQYAGGYMPAIADHDLSVDAGIRESKNALEETPMQMFPTTGRGMTKNRNENYATPLSLDLTRIKSNIDKVLKFSHIEVPVRDAAKVINNREFRASLDTFDKSAGNDLLMPWLKRAATQRSATPGFSKVLDKGFSAFRRASSIQFMVLNVINALQNNLSVFPAMTRVGPAHLAGAFKRYLGSPTEYANTVKETSDYMKSRIGENAQEIGKEIENQILHTTKMQDFKEATIRHGYVLDRMTNSMMEVVIWGAALEQAKTKGSSHEDAVKFADATVRQVTAAFNAEDVSRYETGSPFVRLFTMFSGFFNTQANLLKSEFDIAREEGGAKGVARAAQAYSLVVAAPAIASAMIYAIMSGKGLDKDDDGHYFDDVMDLIFGSQYRYMMAMIPGGNLLTNITNRLNNKPYDDKISLSPAVSALEKAFGAVSSVPKAIKGKGSTSLALKESLTALGLATGTPAGVLAKPLGYAADVAKNKIRPTGPIDTARGLMTGSGKK